ncbi:MAG: formylglycine-generating enzyme family protein, partial [Magnetococcales bacterium]|nr:formylglycine-generating enzyme family protein [Magnetococcales bacterium]
MIKNKSVGWMLVLVMIPWVKLMAEEGRRGAEREQVQEKADIKAQEARQIRDEGSHATPQVTSGASEASIGMEFVRVPGGCFQMGSEEQDRHNEEKPIHEVCLDTFEIARHEITQGQWQAVMGSNPAYFSLCGKGCPVENISWNDVHEFIRKLNAKGVGHYRLPTEAEWEYACRSGGKDTEFSGNIDAQQVAWYANN